MRRIALVVTPLLIIIGFLGYSNWKSAGSLRAERVRVVAAQEAAQKQRAAADQALIAAQTLRVQKSAAEAKAKSHADRARALEARLAAAPTLSEALQRGDEYKSAYESQIEATAALQAAVDTLEPALRKLQRADENLSEASGRLVEATKTPFWQHLIPKVGLGAAAGINPQGKPDAVIGVTLSWPI